jgi:hypothetical protein
MKRKQAQTVRLTWYKATKTSYELRRYEDDELAIARVCEDNWEESKGKVFVFMVFHPNREQYEKGALACGNMSSLSAAISGVQAIVQEKQFWRGRRVKFDRDNLPRSRNV